jgi:photosystem II stability/assembly factor-like uncharacterized protein
MKKTGSFLICLLLLGLAACTAARGTVAPTAKGNPQSPATEAAPVSSSAKPALDVVAADFVSAGVGWMSVRQGVPAAENGRILAYRTEDGGRTWAQQLDFESGSAAPDAGWLRFFDADHGLVLGSDGRRLYSTSDGGSQWASLDLPVAAMDPSMLAFSSPLDGWVLNITGGATGSETADVYRTVDGGAHWETIATTSSLTGTDVPGQLSAGGDKSGIAFKDAGTGWISGSFNTLGASYLAKSSDGGRHWQGQSLDEPASWAGAEISTLPPRFSRSQQGALPIGVNADFYLVFSQDGGERWGDSVRLPGSHDGTSAPLWAFWDADTVMTWMGSGLPWASNHLWTTQDGGRSWADFATPPGMTVGAMGFVDPDLGWALASSGTPGQGIVLLRTANGGKGWTTFPVVLR